MSSVQQLAFVSKGQVISLPASDKPDLRFLITAVTKEVMKCKLLSTKSARVHNIPIGTRVFIHAEY